MSQPLPFPEDPRYRALVAEAVHFITWLLDTLGDSLAPGSDRSHKSLRWLNTHLLLPAEAAVRRALHILADTLAPAPSRLAPAGVGRPSAPPQPKAGPQRVSFRLTEPLLRPKTDYLPLNQRPRITLIGVTPRPAPKPPKPRLAPNPVHVEADLLTRFAALEAVLDNPLKAARRLQRLKARLAARWKKRRQPARPLLAYLAVPGAASEQIGPEGIRILRALNEAAFALARTDTS